MTDFEQKRKEYEDYVNEHIKNVKLMYSLIKDKIDMTKEDRQQLITSINEHDSSKYTQEEFEGYRQWFYPTSNETKNREKFDKSWEHHYKNNKHHWEYWCQEHNDEGLKLLKRIPIINIYEMLCDWGAMSLKFGDTPSEYYESKKDEIKMHSVSRIKVERLLPMFTDAIIEYRKN